MQTLGSTPFVRSVHPFQSRPVQARPKRGNLQVMPASLKDIRNRMNTAKNTQKITDAMRLVAAAKVRLAQEAVMNGRPFAETMVKVLYYVNQRLRIEDVDSPLVAVRPVKTVLLVTVCGDRGLCGGYNNNVIRKTEARVAELESMGVTVKLVCVGRKGYQHFKARPHYQIEGHYEIGPNPAIKEAQAIADEIFGDFVSEEVDKVELIYAKFKSLVSSEPVIQTLLPLSPAGQIREVGGKCVDAAGDEIFRLTTHSGKLVVETEPVATEKLEGQLIFEQDPVQIIDAMLPLYMNSCLLRSLQEALASELSARMNAMSTASDNATEMRRTLSLQYNRKRQSKITTELIEIVSGANC